MLARSAVLGAMLAVAIASPGAQGRPIITTLSGDPSLVTENWRHWPEPFRV